MKSTTFLLLLICLLSTESSSIVYRHDVPLEKYKELARNEAYDCVGMVLKDDKKSLAGSCVLIGDRYVLSAAHVFMVKQSEEHSTTGNKTTIFADRYLGYAKDYYFKFGDEVYQGVLRQTHPEYGAMPHIYSEFDLIIFKLDRVVSNVHPAVLYNATDELGKVITGVGYGSLRRSDELSGAPVLGVKVAGNNIVDSIAGAITSGQQTRLYADFDHPEFPKMNSTGHQDSEALEFLCNGGDSGGGVFILKDGMVELAGIFSTGHVTLNSVSGYYGSVMAMTRVSAFRQWIQQTVSSMKED